jgi:short-subunit dehydrogenase
MEELKKVVLITGATKGIGRAIAFKSAELGLNLSLISRDYSELVKLKTTILDLYPIQVEIFEGNVSLESNCKKWIDHTVSTFKRIDYLFNNAGISMHALFEDCDIRVIKEVMDVNFWGMVYCTKFALPHIKNAKGHIIGISSIAGFKGLPGRTGYSASKFAMNGFLESLRIEQRHSGIHILIACPGYTKSNIRKVALNKFGISQGESPIDESKLMSAELVAEKIWKAVFSNKSYLILTSQGKFAILLNKISPKLADFITYLFISKEKNSVLK